MTASYLRYGRGESLNSIEAKQDGRFPASWWARKIGRGVTAADIVKAIGVGEWHHTGAHARETPFYGAEEIEEAMGEILEAREARKGLVADTFAGKATIVDFYRDGCNRLRAQRREVEGQMTIKGDWLYLPTGERIKRSGKRLEALVRLGDNSNGTI